MSDKGEQGVFDRATGLDVSPVSATGGAHGTTLTFGSTSHSPEFPFRGSPSVHSDKSSGGCSSNDNSDPLKALFMMRRGRFATMIPPLATNWTVSKWMSNLQLKTIDFSTELKMEEWFADAARKFLTHGATAAIALACMALNANETYEMIFSEAVGRLSEITFIEDLADIIALELFFDDSECERLEAAMWVPSRASSVRDAYYKFVQQDLSFRFMCQRRTRTCIIGSDQQRTVFLKRMPQSVSALMKREMNMKQWTLKEMLKRASELEAALKQSADTAYAAEEGEFEDAQVITRPCTRCAQRTHLAKACPYRNYRCARCLGIGHISAACGGGVMKDTAGQPRVILRPGQKGTRA